MPRAKFSDALLTLLQDALSDQRKLIESNARTIATLQVLLAEEEEVPPEIPSGILRSHPDVFTSR